MHREMTSLVRRRQRHVRGLVMSRKTQGATPSGRLHSGGGGCRVVWNRSWGGGVASAAMTGGRSSMLSSVGRVCSLPLDG